MTNHWDTELAIITLGKRCYGDVVGEGCDKDLTVQEAMTCIETALKLGLEAVQEHNDLQNEMRKMREPKMADALKSKACRARERLDKGLAALISVKDLRLKVVRKS